MQGRWIGRPVVTMANDTCLEFCDRGHILAVLTCRTCLTWQACRTFVTRTSCEDKNKGKQ
jgi:hypothetical protein